ncbi:MAG: hypothetical protein AAF702_36145 [Chloroflexota bacterium]
MLATKERKLTIDEFERLYLSAKNGERLLELIHGEIHEKMPTEEHGIISGNLVFAFKLFTKDIIRNKDFSLRTTLDSL